MTGNKSGNVFIELNKEITFNVFGIRTANDCPHRDPIIVRLFLMGLASDKLGEGI